MLAAAFLYPVMQKRDLKGIVHRCVIEETALDCANWNTISFPQPCLYWNIPGPGKSQLFSLNYKMYYYGINSNILLKKNEKEVKCSGGWSPIGGSVASEPIGHSSVHSTYYCEFWSLTFLVSFTQIIMCVCNRICQFVLVSCNLLKNSASSRLWTLEGKYDLWLLAQSLAYIINQWHTMFQFL